MRTTMPLAAIALFVTSCGGSGDPAAEESSDTTVVVTPVTTGALGEPSSTTTDDVEVSTTTATTTSNSSGGELEDFMAEECAAEFTPYVEALVPIVDGRSVMEIRSLDEEAQEALFAAHDEVSDAYNQRLEELGCPEIDLEGRVDIVGAMLARTERDAPGALPLMEVFADLVGYYDEVAAVATGDCDADVALLADLADRDDPNTMTMLELQQVADLVSSLISDCPDEWVEFRDSDTWQRLNETP